jgi:hypothetical protein
MREKLPQNEEYLIALQVKMAINGPDSISTGATSMLKVSGSVEIAGCIRFP